MGQKIPCGAGLLGEKAALFGGIAEDSPRGAGLFSGKATLLEKKEKEWAGKGEARPWKVSHFRWNGAKKTPRGGDAGRRCGFVWRNCGGLSPRGRFVRREGNFVGKEGKGVGRKGRGVALELSLAGRKGRGAVLELSLAGKEGRGRGLGNELCRQGRERRGLGIEHCRQERAGRGLGIEPCRQGSAGRGLEKSVICGGMGQKIPCAAAGLFSISVRKSPRNPPFCPRAPGKQSPKVTLLSPLGEKVPPPRESFRTRAHFLQIFSPTRESFLNL